MEAIAKEKISVGMALVLQELMQRLRYSTVAQEDGKVGLVNRELPFDIRYKLERNLGVLTNIYNDFELEKTKLLRDILKSIDPAEAEGKTLGDFPEKLKEYNDGVRAMGDKEVELEFATLTPEELSIFRDAKDLYNVSSNAMQVFIAFCVADDSFLRSLNVHIADDVKLSEKPAAAPKKPRKPRKKKVEAATVAEPENAPVA